MYMFAYLHKYTPSSNSQVAMRRAKADSRDSTEMGECVLLLCIQIDIYTYVYVYLYMQTCTFLQFIGCDAPCQGELLKTAPKLGSVRPFYVFR